MCGELKNLVQCDPSEDNPPEHPKQRMKWQCGNVFCAGSPIDGPAEVGSVRSRGIPRGQVPSMPNFGGERKEDVPKIENSPLRREQLGEHEERAARQQARERERDNIGAGLAALLRFPGGSISQGLSRERNVLGTPYEAAVVHRAAQDLVFGSK